MRRMIAAGPPAKRPPHSALGGAALSPPPAGRGLSRVTWLCLRAAVAAFALLASTLSAAAQPAEPDKIKLGEFIPAATPQPAPEISFADRAGNPVALVDFKGK